MAEQREVVINSERAWLTAKTENRDDPPEHSLLIWIPVSMTKSMTKSWRDPCSHIRNTTRRLQQANLFPSQRTRLAVDRAFLLPYPPPFSGQKMNINNRASAMCWILYSSCPVVCSMSNRGKQFRPAKLGGYFSHPPAVPPSGDGPLRKLTYVSTEGRLTFTRSSRLRDTEERNNHGI
jgi:hypothetical protein